MPRAATTSDAFNAVAEPKRRRILKLLTQGEHTVTEVTESLDLTQPQVSKHLRVLKKVGLVDVRTSGRLRLYRLSPRGLKPIHDWVSQFERFWIESLERLSDHLADIQADESKTDE